MESESGTREQSICIPEEWTEAAGSVAYDAVTSSPSITLVCGPKNSGKTTFSRVLLQALLKRHKKVAYLDTDVGQPEFTAPGFLSLTVVDESILDSGLTIQCMKTPERCFFFGDVSSKRDPASYLRYIFTLYDYYQIKKSEICATDKLPLVVNTPGWVKGIGYDMLVDIVRYIAPTHVVKINTSSEIKNLPAGAFWLEGDEDEKINLIEIDSARRDSFNRSVLVQKDAQYLRDIRIIAYFKQCIDKEITTIKQLAQELASYTPYEVPISSIKIKHLHCQVPDSETFYSLNATIVGLAVSSDVFEDLSPCVGLGIVRGIDTLKGVIYMITPVPQSVLEKVDLFLQGRILLPPCLLQVKECRSQYMSSHCLSVS